MGAVLSETCHSIVASISRLAFGRTGSKRKTYIPAFPPVTIYTFPERSGRESGWNVIMEFCEGNITP
jgi:hypothetical protein